MNFYRLTEAVVCSPRSSKFAKLSFRVCCTCPPPKKTISIIFSRPKSLNWIKCTVCHGSFFQVRGYLKHAKFRSL